MTTSQAQDAPLWDDEQIHASYKKAFDKDPDVHHWAMLTWMRDDLIAERATLTARIAALEAELELAEGMLQQAGQESNMIFDRGAQRLARIKELEAELAQAQAGRWEPLPDGYTHDNPNWALENIRLCRWHPQDDSWQEGSEA